MLTTIAVSGGFDPLHKGHLALFARARATLPLNRPDARLIVFVDSDEFVAAKHKLMMPWQDRVFMVSNIKGVDSVGASHAMDCCDLLAAMRPDAYMVGPDHREHYKDLPEYKTCMDLGIRFLISDHTDTTHSHDLIKQVNRPENNNLPVTVSAIITDDHGRVLIGRSDTGWCLPGGFVEPGECLTAALYREVEEETNIYDTVDGRPVKYLTSISGTYFDGRKVLAVYFHWHLGGTTPMPRPTKELHQFTWAISPMPLSTDCDTAALTHWMTKKGQS